MQMANGNGRWQMTDGTWQMKVHRFAIMCHLPFGIDSSRTAHAVAAVEAAVAGAAADGQSAAVVAGRRVALEVGELAVLLAQTIGERISATGGCAAACW